MLFSTSRLPVYRWNPCKSLFLNMSLWLQINRHFKMPQLRWSVISERHPVGHPNKRYPSYACRMVSLWFSFHPILSIVLNSPVSNKVLKGLVVFPYNALTLPSVKLFNNATHRQSSTPYTTRVTSGSACPVFDLPFSHRITLWHLVKESRTTSLKARFLSWTRYCLCFGVMTLKHSKNNTLNISFRFCPPSILRSKRHICVLNKYIWGSTRY